MPELHVPSQESFAVRISPGIALALTLPLAELAPRFPGLDPWLAQLPGKLGKAARADIRLLCVPLSGALSLLFEVDDEEESMQPALDFVSAASPEEILTRAVERLAEHSGDDPQLVREWIDREPGRVLAIVDEMERPSLEDPFEIDSERVLHLLRKPAELKSMVELRLRQLWHDHFGPRWLEVLPTCRALADAAQRQFHLGDPEQVLNAIAGRKWHHRAASFQGKRLIFVPIPFLGPYISMAVSSSAPFAYVGFGLVQGESAGGEAGERDLLTSLKALADESRLRAIAYIRRHGEARAVDFMREFGWSQPATSRHLRALESTGLLRSERIDGVKRYTLDPARARAIARSLERLFTGE